MFDLASLDTRAASDEGVLMKVRHPDTDDVLLSDGQPILLRLAGQDSKVFRAIDREHTDKRFKRMGRGGRAELTADELEIERLERVIACTLGWENVYLDGERLPFSQENAHRLYTQLSWLVEQANRFIGERGNFLRASPKS